MIGRNELHVSWNAPEVPLGRFNRYDVLMDDKIVYSGVDHYLNVRRLTPDTEYSFVVRITKLFLSTQKTFEPAHEIMVLKATSEGSVEPAHPRSLARAFAVRTHEVWKYTKDPTKNQTSSPTG